MDKAAFEKIMSSPEHINASHELMLKQMIEKYPYFSIARSLLAKLYNNTHHENYDKALRSAAIHAPSRIKLFKLIEIESIPMKETNEGQTDNKNIFDDLFFDPPQTYTMDIPKEEELNIDQLSEKFRLQNVDTLHVSETLIVPEKCSKEDLDLFDTLLQPLFEEEEPIKIPQEKIITETMAKIYEDQELYIDAIDTYYELIIRYPEKNDYFRKRILSIKEKIKK